MFVGRQSRSRPRAQPYPLALPPRAPPYAPSDISYVHPTRRISCEARAPEPRFLMATELGPSRASRLAPYPTAPRLLHPLVGPPPAHSSDAPYSRARSLASQRCASAVAGPVALACRTAWPSQQCLESGQKAPQSRQMACHEVGPSIVRGRRSPDRCASRRSGLRRSAQIDGPASSMYSDPTRAQVRFSATLCLGHRTYSGTTHGSSGPASSSSPTSRRSIVSPRPRRVGPTPQISGGAFRLFCTSCPSYFRRSPAPSAASGCWVAPSSMAHLSVRRRQ